MNHKRRIYIFLFLLILFFYSFALIFPNKALSELNQEEPEQESKLHLKIIESPGRNDKAPSKKSMLSSSISLEKTADSFSHDASAENFDGPEPETIPSDNSLSSGSSNPEKDTDSFSSIDSSIKDHEANVQNSEYHNQPISSDLEEKPESPKENDDFLIPEDQKDLFTGKLVEDGNVDFKKIGQKLRIYSNFMKGLSFSQAAKSKKRLDWLNTMESHLFPWIQNRTFLLDSFEGTGLVICVGNDQAKMAAAALKMIRQVHHSTIPIEVFYIGDGDLSESNRNILKEIPFVTTKDIKKIFNDDILQIGGWAIKPFALLGSSFQHAMLIDADVVFLQNPEVLFHSHIYARKHALFFHDRSLFTHSDATVDWFKDLIPPEKAADSQHLRVFNKKSAHEQESGVVLIDKKKNVHGLLAACTLNMGSIRSKTYNFVFGDKETFWLGFETVSASYQFNGYYPGAIGVFKEEEQGKYKICARQILHVDENETPIWINGGIQESKYEESSHLAKMEHYIMEPGEWTLYEGNMACLVVSRKPKAIPKIIADKISESGSILWETLRH